MAKKSERVWVFDLDNTLYPSDIRLFSQVDRRMGTFISALLGVDGAAARKVQKSFLVSHGTTLRGLMDEHGVDPHEFLDFVHDIDLSPLDEAPVLKHAIDRLDGRKLVFTNADRPYAERVLERLGLGDAFDGIFDIIDAEFRPKPDGATYDRMITRFEFDPTGATMFEDMARNLKPARERGMRTVWLRNDSPWGQPGREEGFIDHEIDDLAGWLSTSD